MTDSSDDILRETASVVSTRRLASRARLHSGAKIDGDDAEPGCGEDERLRLPARAIESSAMRQHDTALSAAVLIRMDHTSIVSTNGRHRLGGRVRDRAEREEQEEHQRCHVCLLINCPLPARPMTLPPSYTTSP